MTSAKPESEQRLVESPFAALVNRSLTLFKSLVTGLEDDAVHRSLAVSHAAKFKLWAGSLGAHRSSGSRSLMYRLRDASFIRNHILSLLQDLCESLNEAVSLITESDTPPVSHAPDATLEELAEYFHDGETEQEDEIDAVINSIGHEINCLLRLSVTIRNPAPHDQFKSRAGAEIVQHFKHWDMQHVKAKFPDANGNVQERLAEATSRRRQYLKYREEHTARIAEGLDEDTAQTVADPVEGATTLASSLPDHLKSFQSISEPLMNDNISEASGTSYATSVSSSHRLRVPPLPAEHEDGPVKCPFCHMFILVRNRSEWKRHVFRDLQPYICLRDDCSAPDHLYARRADWMEHMKAEHWRVWHCIFGCPGTFDSKKELQAHLHATHGQDSSGAKLASLESPSGRADIGKIEKCPLCASFWCESVQKYEQHIGRHLEDLALFVLPSTGDDEGSDESEIEEDIRAVGDGQAGVDQDAVPESQHFDQDQPLNSKFRRLSTVLSEHLDPTLHEFGSVSPPQQPGSTSQGTIDDAMELWLLYERRRYLRLLEDHHIHLKVLEAMQTCKQEKSSHQDVDDLVKLKSDSLRTFSQLLSSTDSNSKEEQNSNADIAADAPNQAHIVDTMASESDPNTASQVSSYWSVEESNDFPLLLAAFGSDWNTIANHMPYKNAIMVRNFYVRRKDQTKPGWEGIVAEADSKRMRGEKMPSPPTRADVRVHVGQPPVANKPGDYQGPEDDTGTPYPLPASVMVPDSVEAFDPGATPSDDIGRTENAAHDTEDDRRVAQDPLKSTKGEALFTAEMLREAGRSDLVYPSTSISNSRDKSELRRSHSVGLNRSSSGNGSEDVTIEVRGRTLKVQDGAEITLSSREQPQASRAYQDESERGLLREVAQADDDDRKDALDSVTQPDIDNLYIELARGTAK
ncbi:hypothetical protein MY10362_008386 [Beauveria mimosiformis]